jgi:hypothetical protein
MFIDDNLKATKEHHHVFPPLSLPARQPSLPFSTLHLISITGAVHGTSLLRSASDLSTLNIALVANEVAVRIALVVASKLFISQHIFPLSSSHFSLFACLEAVASEEGRKSYTYVFGFEGFRGGSGCYLGDGQSRDGEDDGVECELHSGGCG